MMTENINKLTEDIIGAAIEVHCHLGPGLLESSYHKALAQELRLRDHEVLCEIHLPIIYKGQKIEDAYRIDIMVDNTVVIELKAIERLENLHKAQLLTYLRMSGKQIGLLINFNVPRLKEGIRRIVNNLPE